MRRCARLFSPHGSRRSGNIGTLRRYRSAIAGLVERHDGRIVNTWGDAVIAEFASVVEAVQCAVEIRQEISNQDSDPPHAHQMRFRIGVNLGDVMVDGSDIFGDGVNIAARLQEFAEPGGGVVAKPPKLEQLQPWKLVLNRYEPPAWMGSISNRLANLPRPIAATLTVSGFLILINVFTGLHRIWFHWPVAALLFIGILRTALRARPASDRNEDHRRRRE